VIFDWFGALELLFFADFAGEAEPFIEIVEDAADFALAGIALEGDAADAVMEEVMGEADGDESFTEAHGAIKESGDHWVREASGEHGDAAADGAGVGANEGGDLTEGVAAGEGEVEEVLVGGWEFVKAVEEVGARLFGNLFLGALVVSAAEIEDELQITSGHLTPLSGLLGPLKRPCSANSPWPGLLHRRAAAAAERTSC